MATGTVKRFDDSEQALREKRELKPAKKDAWAATRRGGDDPPATEADGREDAA